MLKEFKSGFLIAISFFLTLGIAGVSYAAWVNLSNVNPGDSLTDTLFNQVLENQRVLKTNVDNINTSNINLPVGSIIAWHKSLSGVPSLPNGWVECNGSTINDVNSPLNGQIAPNLNNQVYSGGKGYYLRGGNTSGSFNSSSAWDDNGNAYSSNVSIYYGGNFGRYVDLENSSSLVNYSTSPLNPDNFRFQVAAMTVVYIMKIK